jgi:hypothetical protein
MDKNEKEDIIVSMAIPDTLPGPGTYQVKMDNTPGNEGDIPDIVPIESIENFRGHGTAHDVASTDLTS